MFIFDFNWQIQSFLNLFWWQINFLLLVILVVLGYLSYKKPVYAVSLTIIMLPTYLFRADLFGIPITFLELCILTTFLGYLIKLITEKQLKKTYNLQPTTYNLKWPVTLIIVAATISVLISPDLQGAGGLWKAYFIEPILFFLVVIKVWPEAKNQKIILWSLGISTLIISLLAIFQKFTGFGIAQAGWIAPESRRVTSIFTSPNAVGLYLGPIVAIYLGWIMSEIRNCKNIKFCVSTILKLLIILPALLAIFFTVSQGTAIGLATAVVFLAFFACPPKPEGRRWGWNKKWTSGVIAILLVIILIVPIAREKMLPIITLQDTSGQNRIELAILAVDHLTKNIQNFILGAGILGFDQIQDQMRDPLKIEDLLYPHNIILNFWLELGMLGLIAFIWLIIKFFKKGFKTYSLQPTPYNLLTLGIMAGMVTIIVHGLVDVPYFKNDLAVLFWILIALI